MMDITQWRGPHRSHAATEIAEGTSVELTLNSALVVRAYENPQFPEVHVELSVLRDGQRHTFWRLEGTAELADGGLKCGDWAINAPQSFVSWGRAVSGEPEIEGVVITSYSRDDWERDVKEQRDRARDALDSAFGRILDERSE